MVVLDKTPKVEIEKSIGASKSIEKDKEKGKVSEPVLKNIP